MQKESFLSAVAKSDIFRAEEGEGGGGWGVFMELWHFNKQFEKHNKKVPMKKHFGVFFS